MTLPKLSAAQKAKAIVYDPKRKQHCVRGADGTITIRVYDPKRKQYYVRGADGTMKLEPTPS